jgi:hypothetical protein
MSILYDYFLKHPHENKLTYFQHLLFSTNLGFYFMGHSFKAFVHAFLPFLFETSSSDAVKELDHLFKIMHND